MSINDSADGQDIFNFFTDLEKQFIGLCAFFVSRGANYENFSPQSRDYILKHIEAIQLIVLWVQDPAAECGVEDTAIFAFVIGLGQASINRNNKNHIKLHTDEQQRTTISYDGERRKIHR